MHCLSDSDHEHRDSYLYIYQLEGKDLIDITRSPTCKWFMLGNWIFSADYV